MGNTKELQEVGKLTRDFISIRVKNVLANGGDKEIVKKSISEIKTCLKMNMENLTVDELASIENNAKMELGLLQKRTYIVSIKFGRESLTDIEFTAFSKEDAENEALKICEDLMKGYDIVKNEADASAESKEV